MAAKQKKVLRIVITTGDADGIGTEVTFKALQKIKPIDGVQFIVWRSSKCPKSHLDILDKSFKRITVSSWPDALAKSDFKKNEIIDINSQLSPAHWVETSAKAALSGHVDAMATGPLSKTTIKAAGMKDIGHTDILARVSGVENVFMCFIGKYFNVLLSTGHLPISKVAKQWPLHIHSACLAAEKVRCLLDKKMSKLPLGILGLNPHSGENTLIGNEEASVWSELSDKLKASKIDHLGPLVPDAAFIDYKNNKYSIYVCAYHDQALIPFKIIHGQDSGVHISLGLPFIRTSVDHGTAKDIFGKNKANPNSMIEAIEWAIKLSQNNQKYASVFS